MAMNDAFNFIARCKCDADFRGRLYDAAGPAEFRAVMRETGFDFTDAELSDGISRLKIKAFDEDDAAEIFEFSQWYRAMAGAGELATAASCSACPSGASCSGQCS
jgi:predicted ribosomally synthesized peptide with nif11-like leader